MIPSRLTVVVGAGGVGKTTLAAALGVLSARSGDDTLVMTFDPSRRLKDALRVGDDAAGREVPVRLDAAGRIAASVLDVRETFDRLVARYAPDAESRDRILRNRFYTHLSGSLAGVLEYVAVERLFEVAEEGRWRRVILDTPPTRQALDFLQAPERLVGFLDSGALRIALKPWFDEHGRLRTTARLGLLGRNVEAFLDRLIGLELLRDMAEFFQAFGPLYQGFRQRAIEVQSLLRSASTEFVLVSGPGEERIADTMFFARKLAETGHRLGPVIVNRVHPIASASELPGGDGGSLMRWLGERDRRGVAALEQLLAPARRPLAIPLLHDEPVGIAGLAILADRLTAEFRRVGHPPL